MIVSISCTISICHTRISYFSLRRTGGRVYHIGRRLRQSANVYSLKAYKSCMYPQRSFGATETQLKLTSASSGLILHSLGIYGLQPILVQHDGLLSHGTHKRRGTLGVWMPGWSIGPAILSLHHRMMHRSTRDPNQGLSSIEQHGHLS